jgi:hypothetical protein
VRLLLQSLLYEKFGAGANDLPDGVSGVEGRGVRRRKVGGAVDKGKKRARAAIAIASLHGWECGARMNEMFEIERLMIGRMVSDGGEVPGRTGVPAGRVLYLYRVLRAGFAPGTPEIGDRDVG